MRRLRGRARVWVSSGELAWLALVAALYAGLVVWFTYPLASVAESHVLFEPAHDQLWIMGLLEWQRTALFDRPDQFFASHFYYGSGNALFGSDLMMGMLPLSAPVAWLTDNPTLAFNAAYMGSMFLNALAMYAAARTMVKSRAGAFLAGVIYAFGPIQMSYAFNVQFGPAWWLPLALLFAVRFGRRRRWTDAALAVAMVWMQFVTTVQLGLHAALIVAAFAGPPALRHIATRRDWRLAGQLLGVGVAGAAIFAPIVWGYVEYSGAWHLERHITEVQRGSAQLEDYLALRFPLRDYLPPTTHLHWYDAVKDHFPSVTLSDRRLFPGFAPLALGLLGAGAGLLARGGGWPGRRRTVITLLILAAGGVLLSLGPNWRWQGATTDIELPYLALYDTLLPMRAIRYVARFALITHVAMALLAAVGLAVVERHVNWRPRLAAIGGLAVAGLVVFEAWPNPMTVYPAPDRPEVLAALRETRDGAVLFVPVASRQEMEWTWWAARARSGPLINGYSAHIWRHAWFLKERTQRLSVTEADAMAAGLSALGVRTVMLDERQLEGNVRRVWAAIRAGPHVENVAKHGEFWRIRLRPPSVPPSRDWTDLRAEFLLESVQPSAGLIGSLVLENAMDRPWTPPGDARFRALDLAWIASDGEVVLRRSTDMLPPPFLMQGQVHRLPVHVFTPTKPGAYRLQGRIDGVTVINQPVRVGAISPALFRGDGQGLRANLTLRTPAHFEVPKGDPMPLHVDALNTGEVAWKEPAVIRLGWRVFKLEADGSERELPDREARIILEGHDYSQPLPGTGYAFAGVIFAPPEPGRYVARVSMLAELVAWFDIPPIEIQILVTP